MKGIDFKSMLIGVLATALIVVGVGAAGPQTASREPAGITFPPLMIDEGSGPPKPAPKIPWNMGLVAVTSNGAHHHLWLRDQTGNLYSVVVTSQGSPLKNTVESSGLKIEWEPRP